MSSLSEIKCHDYTCFQTSSVVISIQALELLTALLNKNKGHCPVNPNPNRAIKSKKVRVPFVCSQRKCCKTNGKQTKRKNMQILYMRGFPNKFGRIRGLKDECMVLDFACGSTSFLRIFVERFCKIFFVDTYIIFFFITTVFTDSSWLSLISGQHHKPPPLRPVH